MADVTITSLGADTTPDMADVVVTVDLAGPTTKKATIQNLIGNTLGPIINAFTGKTTPVAADSLALMDSAASNAAKKLTIANLQAMLDTRPVSAKTANYTVLAADHNTIFTNAGAAGLVDFALPASAGCVAGKTRFTFCTLVGNQVSLTPNGSDHLFFFQDFGPTAYDATSGTPAISNGEIAEIMTIQYLGGTTWIALSNNGRWAA